MPRITAAAAKVALALSALVLCTITASAVSMRVRTACASDYMAYCSQHDPDGPGVVAAGEVSKAEVARRAAGK